MHCKMVQANGGGGRGLDDPISLFFLSIWFRVRLFVSGGDLGSEATGEGCLKVRCGHFVGLTG